jgi:Uri superfamily endonuclease
MTEIFCANADGAPSLPGAYVLAIEITKPVTVKLPGKPAASLRSGRYLYCGSAKGPGGIRARLRRHMGRGKSLHWHVDRLTEAGTVLGAWVFPGGDECDLVVALSSLPAPIAGFGSTDCTRCRAHLLRWPEAMQSIPVVIGQGRDGNERSLRLRI